jgi:hypothetical protein
MYIPDDQDAVDVEGHPGKVGERSKDHLQVDVVSEQQPQAKH